MGRVAPTYAVKTERRGGERERERELVLDNTTHNRLTKHHINLQVHLIVGKLNATLSEGGDQYIELAWLTTSNPANLLEVLKCCIEYLNDSESTA